MPVPARALVLICALLWVAPAFAADIAAYFKLYYRQQVASGTYKGPLDFLRDDGKGDSIADSNARWAKLDRANGYLQLGNKLGTDQILTMAVYHKAAGGELLLVGSSNCADACSFLIEFFTPAAEGLQPVRAETVLPAVDPAHFIKPGQTGPKNAPTINYLPAQVGTSLTLKPWYGYEVEEQMNRTSRAAIQDVVLQWDRASGRFR